MLHAFCSLPDCADGGYNLGTSEYTGRSEALVMDAVGNLFGVTPSGGALKRGCCGVLFKIAAGTPPGAPDAYTVLYNFCSLNNCKDGANPNGSLLLDESGSLYGTTQTGGGHNLDVDRLGGGTVFRWSGSKLTTFYAFCGAGSCLDGTYPYAGLITDGEALLGTTANGGPNANGENIGDGTVFAIVK